MHCCWPQFMLAKCRCLKPQTCHPSLPCIAGIHPSLPCIAIHHFPVLPSITTLYCHPSLPCIAGIHPSPTCIAGIHYLPVLPSITTLYCHPSLPCIAIHHHPVLQVSIHHHPVLPSITTLYCHPSLPCIAGRTSRLKRTHPRSKRHRQISTGRHARQLGNWRRPPTHKVMQGCTCGLLSGFMCS